MNENIPLTEKFHYTKRFLEIALEKAYDGIYSRDTGLPIYIDPNSQDSNNSIKKIELSESHFQKILSQENGIFLTPTKQEEFFRPNTVIKNIEEFETLLKKYVNYLNTSNKNFYKIDKKHNFSSYMYYLVKTLTNSDNQDLSQYIQTFIGFLHDNNFKNLKKEGKIGSINLDNENSNYFDVLARRAEEYYGSETPYTMRYALDKKGFKYTMPFVRYGISGNQAYIYSIQRKGKTNFKHKRIKELNGKFNSVNSGVKHDRDITPSMLVSATIFLGMLKGIGIENIKIADFLTRRFGHYEGFPSYEESLKLQENITNKFLKTFNRLANQFNGIDIISYPNDYDSYLNLKLGKNISSKNKLLNDFFELGFNYGKNQIDIER